MNKEALTEIPNFFCECLEHRFQCFGCSKYNEQSLKGRFYINEQNDNEKQRVFGFFPPVGDSRTSFPGLVHGGILSTMVDDTAYWTLFQNFRLLAVTTEMNVKYLLPCSNNVEILAQGELSAETPKNPKAGDKIHVNVTLFNNTTNKKIVIGSVTFFVLPKENIPKIMGPTSNEILNKL